MRGLSGRGWYVLVFLVAVRVGWAAWEFVFRHYGPGTVTGPLLLNATPQAAVVAAIAWLTTTLVVMVGGVVVIRILSGIVG